MIARLDHVVYRVPTNLLNDVIEQMIRAGFMEHTRRVHHSDGRTSVFFRVSGGYLEFCSDEWLPCSEQHASRCSIWLCSTDLVADAERLPTAQREALEILKKSPLGDDEPAWLIANLSTRCGEEVSVSLIEYLRGIGGDLAFRIPDNGLFAIIAVSMRCNSLELERNHYVTSLGVLLGANGVREERFNIGHQWLDFLNSDAPQYDGPLLLSQASCLVHMATINLEQTTFMLKAADFIVDEVAGIGLLAQSKLAPAVCLVLCTGLDPDWHQALLLARSQ